MIDKIFDEAAIRRNAEEAAKAVETYNQAIENIKKNLKSLSVKIEINDPSQIIPQIEKLNATILSVSQSANEANKSLEKLTTSQLRAAKAATEEAKQQTEAAKQAKIRAQEQAILNKQNQQGQRITVTLSEALNNEAKTMAEAAAQNRVLRKAAKELDLTMEGAQDTLTQYNDKINKNTEFIRANSDAATKQKMNIGNYKSVLNGLNVSVSQIIREAPSAKYGLDIFFLAMKAYNAEMVSLGKTSEKINIGKALLSSVFSWNTLLIAGLTVLTLYGEEIIDWVKGLFKGKEALDGTRKAQEALNDAWKDGTKNAQEELTRLRLLYKAATDDAASVDTRRIAREKILEMAEEYNLSISKEKNSIAGLSNIYQELTKAILASSIARAQENKVVKLSEEISDKLYEAGIRLCFQENGISDEAVINEYLSQTEAKDIDYVDPYNSENNIAGRVNVGVKWDDTDSDETKLEKIITQKYIANFPMSAEAWTTFRRTGYPRIFPVEVNNMKDQGVDTELQLRRIPIEETVNNTLEIASLVEALGQPNTGASRVFWDKQTEERGEQSPDNEFTLVIPVNF